VAPQDPEMRTKISTWGCEGYFLTWLVHVYLTEIAGKRLNIFANLPVQVKDAIAKYERANDHIGTFLKEKLTAVGQGNTSILLPEIPLHILYTQYLNYLRTKRLNISPTLEGFEYNIINNKIYGPAFNITTKKLNGFILSN
jgi:hypothetical protein